MRWWVCPQSVPQGTQETEAQMTFLTGPTMGWPTGCRSSSLCSTGLRVTPRSVSFALPQLGHWSGTGGRSFSFRLSLCGICRLHEQLACHSGSSLNSRFQNEATQKYLYFGQEVLYSSKSYV